MTRYIFNLQPQHQLSSLYSRCLQTGVEICKLLSCSPLLDGHSLYQKRTTSKPVLAPSAEVQLFSTLLCPDKMGCAWVLYWPFQGEVAGQGQPASLDEPCVPAQQAAGGRPPLGETGPVPLEPGA